MFAILGVGVTLSDRLALLAFCEALPPLSLIFITQQRLLHLCLFEHFSAVIWQQHSLLSG